MQSIINNINVNAVSSAPLRLASSSASAVIRLAQQDPGLIHVIESAEEMNTFDGLQADWIRVLAANPEFADDLASVDPYVCSLGTLAKLIAQAPTTVIRQALRETAHCREQMTLMLGLQQPEIDERTQLVLSGANAEWEILLSAHPLFEACLRTLDRFTCSRADLSDVILLAPTDAIRHTLRETFCFREVASLITTVEFA